MNKRKFRDPLSGRRFASEKSCIEALERDHGPQLSAFRVTARQLCFNSRNRLALGTRNGKSVLSGRPTEWNEKAGRYERFADDAERQQYRKMFLERMRSTYGKDHLLDDPDRQRMMLANRSISGKYRFADGSEKTYTGQEELALLRFLNEALEWPGADVHCPAPQNFPYEDGDGARHWYIPDAYIETLNLVVEVKGEMHDGYRSRDIAVERTKDEILGTSGFAYVKVESQDYADLLDAMASASAKLETSTDGGR
jgi:hypothetical protein